MAIPPPFTTYPLQFYLTLSLTWFHMLYYLISVPTFVSNHQKSLWTNLNLLHCVQWTPILSWQGTFQPCSSLISPKHSLILSPNMIKVNFYNWFIITKIMVLNEFWIKNSPPNYIHRCHDIWFLRMIFQVQIIVPYTINSITSKWIREYQ